MNFNDAASTTSDEEGTVPDVAGGGGGEQVFACSTPTSRGQFGRFNPPACLINLSGIYESDEEEVQFFRVRKRYDFDSDSDSSEEQITIP